MKELSYCISKGHICTCNVNSPQNPNQNFPNLRTWDRQPSLLPTHCLLSASATKQCLAWHQAPLSVDAIYRVIQAKHSDWNSLSTLAKCFPLHSEAPKFDSFPSEVDKGHLCELTILQRLQFQAAQREGVGCLQHATPNYWTHSAPRCCKDSLWHHWTRIAISERSCSESSTLLVLHKDDV